MVTFMYRWTLMILAALFLEGCSTFSPKVRDDAPIDMPKQYTLFSESEGGPDLWWQAFNSKELNELVGDSLSNNFDIQTAWARLKQAQAVAQKTNANKMPTLDYDGGAQYRRIESRLSSDDDVTTTDDQAWRLGMAASYEMDLWGKLHSRRQAEAYRLEAARHDHDAAVVTVSAKVTTTWVDILATRQNISILLKQINNNEKLLKLQRLRFMNGRAKALGVSQQRGALAAARAELPLLQLRERQLINSLVFLMGKATASDLNLRQKTLPEVIPMPATGLPVDLLAARPDVRAAGLRLQAADWEVVTARADRLPAFALSAQGIFSSGSLDLLFDNWVANLAAGIAGPLFDGGRRTAEVERVRAVAEERLASYAGTVANAVREVEDSLVAEDRQRVYLQRLTEQLQAVRLTLKAAGVQYQNGQGDYLSYLIAWTGLQRLERQVVTEKATLIKNRVALYRTLGGDWMRHAGPKG
jgi:multidrug efflux system outer membrane protein